MRFLLTGVLLGVLGAGCYATTGSYGYSSGVAVTATVDTPDLVYVSPGVQVIADYDEPVFYTDGFYWRETGGIWYRSSHHSHGWVTYSAPRTVVSIQNRHSYRRYRPAGYTPRANRHHERRDHRQPVVRDNRHHQPAVRDHRDHRAPVVRDNRHHQPAARDHRDHDRRREAPKRDRHDRDDDHDRDRRDAPKRHR